jgi:hypothetical protein
MPDGKRYGHTHHRLHERAPMLCLYAQCLSCVSFKHKVSVTRYVSVTKSILSNRSKWARSFSTLHLTTSKTIHMFKLYCKAGSQNSYVWLTCHLWIPAMSWKRWACTNTDHLSGFCPRICKWCTIESSPTFAQAWCPRVLFHHSSFKDGPYLTKIVCHFTSPRSSQ